MRAITLKEGAIGTKRRGSYSDAANQCNARVPYHGSATELTEKRANTLASMQATLSALRVSAAQIADLKR